MNRIPREEMFWRAAAAAMFALTLTMFYAAWSVAVTGCGAQLSAQARTNLATETQLCLVREREIVDRTGTSAEQDAADLATERARCDAARAAIVGSP